jgi:FkbM family methyltransferase
MAATVTLELPDRTRIVVPDAPDLVTTYVLREQGDWFEAELPFLRGFLRPGEQAIDIGASYGVYTLAMARAVGPGGRVWAFEPEPGTAALLAQSLEANGFSQVVLERGAVAGRTGTGRLSVRTNSELSALVEGDGPGEAVALTTLDDALARFGWRAVDVLKMDAEGAESEILRGGRRFFAQLEPLVLYEVRKVTTLYLGLVDEFAALGYDAYRLVPGLGLLAPFDATEQADGFLLNLFGCKAATAERLAQRGLLVRQALPPKGVPGRSVVEQALALHALSRDAARPPAERLGALEAAFVRLRNLWEMEPTPGRAASLARVAQELGERSFACLALKELAGALKSGPVDLREPFLAPGARFDAIPRGDRAEDWLRAAALEELERLGNFSSFYAGAGSLPRLEAIERLGYGSEEMARRLALVRGRLRHAQ